jgi:hypothetical protein
VKAIERHFEQGLERHSVVWRAGPSQPDLVAASLFEPLLDR